MSTLPEIQSAIVTFLEETFLFSFRDDAIAAGDNLFERGLLDSYGLVQLISFLEGTFAVEVDDSLIVSGALSSLASIEAFVRRATANAS